MTQAAVQAEYRVNGSNQRDISHWIWSAPPAAMADEQVISAGATWGRFSAIAVIEVLLLGRPLDVALLPFKYCQ